jgi:hypothetical protein
LALVDPVFNASDGMASIWIERTWISEGGLQQQFERGFGREVERGRCDLLDKFRVVCENICGFLYAQRCILVPETRCF